MFTCPVCFYLEMPDPPQDYHICPCCGTEFGNDDQDVTYTELRNQWVNAGTPWFFGQPPHGWDPQAQLKQGSSVVGAGSSVSTIRVEFGGGVVRPDSAFAAVAGVGVGFYTFQPNETLVLHDSLLLLDSLVLLDSEIERTMNPNVLSTI